MAPSNDLILITGVTGYLGFRTLRYALDEGYAVHAVVRSDSKAEPVKAALARTKTSNSQLTFVTIPDLLAPDAFDSVLEDVKYIIHVASPSPDKIFPSETDFDAAHMTLNVFESAQKFDSVKRIVVTSSAGAIAPLNAWFESVPKISAEDRGPEIPGPFDNPLFAYAASKIAALNRAETWVEEKKPHFDVIHVQPVYVLGRDDLYTSTAEFKTGTNRLVLNHAIGITDPTLAARGPYFASVHDTAMVHVKSLDPKVAGNQSFIVANSDEEKMEWNQANDIVAKHFKKEVESGVLPNNGTTVTIPSAFDVKKTEETFGFKHAGFKEMVVEVVQQYLELLEKEKSTS